MRYLQVGDIFYSTYRGGGADFWEIIKITEKNSTIFKRIDYEIIEIDDEKYVYKPVSRELTMCDVRSPNLERKDPSRLVKRFSQYCSPNYFTGDIISLRRFKENDPAYFYEPYYPPNY